MNDDSPICISAIGAVTPLGETFEEISQALFDGRSGIREIRKFDTAQFKSKWAGIPEFGNERIRWPRESGAGRFRPGELVYAERAIAALAAQVDVSDHYRPERIGCALGVDESSIDIQRCIELMQKPGTRLEPRESFIGQAADHFRVSELLDLDSAAVLKTVHERVPFAGYARAHVGLCSASLQAIGLGLRAIRSGKVDAAVVGGVSGKVTPVQIARLEGIGAVCLDGNLAGPQRSRPFDARRSGFVPAEGAVLFLLERESAVRKRAGKVYGRVLGYGSSLGAQHIIAPHTEEAEMNSCMSRALADADLLPESIDCVNTHGTSTKLNDRHEARALTRLFSGVKSPVVAATKSLHGHMIAAAGAMEVLTSLISFERDFVPAIANLENPEPEMGLVLARERVDGKVRRVLKNSFGMGGLAASVVLENPNE